MLLVFFLQSFSVYSQNDCFDIFGTSINEYPSGVAVSNCINITSNCIAPSNTPNTPYLVTSGNSIYVWGESYVSPGNSKNISLLIDENSLLVVKEFPSTSTIPKNTKIELGVQIPLAAMEKVNNYIYNLQNSDKLNPFDPQDIDIQATFERKSGSFWFEKGKQYGFYYRDYERDISSANVNNWKWIEQEVENKFRIRYTPTEVGNWRVNITININGMGSFATLPYYFRVVESNKKGYLKIDSDDPKYFSREGEWFYPVGQNQWGPTCKDSQYCQGVLHAGEEEYHKVQPLKSYLYYQNLLDTMKNNGANHVRFIIDENSSDIEFEFLGNYYKRLNRAWEVDKILEKAEELDIIMTFNLALHTRIEIFSVYGKHFSDWAGGNGLRLNDTAYCYNQIQGVTSPVDFFTNPDAKRFFKNRLRYLMSRYGYSTSLGLVELINEVNNVGKSDNVKYVPSQVVPYWSLIDTTTNFVFGDTAMTQSPSLYDSDTTVPYKVYLWQHEMLGYLKNDLGLKEHIYGVSYAGNSLKLNLKDSTYFSPNVDYIGFNYGSLCPDRFERLREIYCKYQYPQCQYYLGFQNNNNIQGLNIMKPIVNSEMAMFNREGCDGYSEWLRQIWFPPFLGAAHAANWAYQFQDFYPVSRYLGHLKTFLDGCDFRNKSNFVWTPHHYINSYKKLVETVYMRGVENNTRFHARGVVSNRTYNYYTLSTDSASDCNVMLTSTDCENHYATELYTLTNVSHELFDNSQKIYIDNMGVSKSYIVDWFDCLNGVWASNPQFISSTSSGQLELKFPTLSAIGSSPSPMWAFKVTPNYTRTENAGLLLPAINSKNDDSDVLTEEDEYFKLVTEAENRNIIVYPNPTNGVLIVENLNRNSEYGWRLSTSAGDVVLSGKWSGNNIEILNITHLVSGFYTLHLSNSVLNINFKVIKH